MLAGVQSLLLPGPPPTHTNRRVRAVFRYRLDLDLFGEIVPELSKYTVRQTKIEIKLKKAAAAASANWPGLTKPTAAAPATVYPEDATVVPYVCLDVVLLCCCVVVLLLLFSGGGRRESFAFLAFLYMFTCRVGRIAAASVPANCNYCVLRTMGLYMCGVHPARRWCIFCD